MLVVRDINQIGDNRTVEFCGDVTFVMRNDTSWDFYLSSGRQVARRWLQEEEGLLGNRVIQLFDMVRVVTTDCHNLKRELAAG